jgi:transposase
MMEYREAKILRQQKWQMREELETQIKDLLDENRALEKRVAELEAEKKALHERQFKPNKRKKKLKQQTKPRDRVESDDDEDKPKKRGAPVGHPGWSRRKPDHIDNQVPVPAPDVCPHCRGTDLEPSEEIVEHLQEDIVLRPHTMVTNFVHGQALCRQCDRLVLQAGEGELLNCEIGPVTKAAAIYLRYGLRIPYRKVSEFFETFFGMPFVPASAMNFDRKATENGEALYDDLKEKLRALNIAYADETHWREDGQNAYIRYGGNEELAVFLVDRSRSGDVAVKLLGENFPGALVTDGYAAYNAVNALFRQTCLPHLIRKAEEIENEILLAPEEHQDANALRFCRGIAKAFRKACKIGKRLRKGDMSYDTANKLIPRFYSLIDIICTPKLGFHKAESFRQRILDPKREYNRLFTFLKIPGLSPTNNHSEQTLRSPVIFRKICFGTRSEEGSRSLGILLSLLVTAQRQGVNPISFFSTLLAADAADAQVALFNDSS